MVELKDDSILHFGKTFRGYKLANVPAWYLLWIYDNYRLTDNLKAYIEKNRDVLQQQKKDDDRARFR